MLQLYLTEHFMHDLKHLHNNYLTLLRIVLFS